jgi:4-hydroxybenzoate polyprenyltransferase
VLVALTSVVVNRAYSSGPASLAGRAILAPLTLSVAYTAIPYATALCALHQAPIVQDVPFLIGAMLLFASRIVLKDVRDQAGDERAGKATLLARYGLHGICRISAVLLMSGVAVTALGLARVIPPTVMLGLAPLVAGLLVVLLLLDGEGRRDQQLKLIAVGVRLGNVLVAAVIGQLVLSDAGAATQAITLLPLALTAWTAVSIRGGLPARPQPRMARSPRATHALRSEAVR